MQVQGRGNYNFAADYTMNLGGNARNLVIADVDMDGKLDVIASVQGALSTNRVAIFRNTHTTGAFYSGVIRA